MSTQKAPAWTHEQLEARLLRPPFNRWLGLELVGWDDRSITIGLRARNDLRGRANLGYLHGGILATVVDVACSMCVIMRTGESVFTVDMRIDYLRPATAEEYTVRGEILRLGRTLATADAQVIAADGKVVAAGRAVLQHTQDVASG